MAGMVLQRVDANDAGSPEPGMEMWLSGLGRG
jgi:hypothetical protein